MNFEYVKKLQFQTSGMKVDFSKSLPELCPICIERKQTRKQHNQECNRTSRPLQLIHSDIVGFVSPTSDGGERYVFAFIDDYTHFTVCYILGAKSEVLPYYKMFEAMATAHFNLK